MKLDEIIRLLVTISGDAGRELSITPEVFSSTLHLASLKHFKRKLGLPEEYSPGMPYPQQAYEINQRITEDLKIFKVNLGWHLTAPVAVAPSGIVAYPSDYYIASAITYFWSDGVGTDKYEREVTILSDLEYQNRTTSVHKKPRLFLPVCKMIAEGILCAPRELKFVHMAYLRLPVAPVYAVDAKVGYNEYSESTSTQLEWDDMNTIDILVIFLSDLGITLNSADVIQYAEKVKERGI